MINARPPSTPPTIAPPLPVSPITGLVIDAAAAIIKWNTTDYYLIIPLLSIYNYYSRL